MPGRRLSPEGGTWGSRVGGRCRAQGPERYLERLRAEGRSVAVIGAERGDRASTTACSSPTARGRMTSASGVTREGPATGQETVRCHRAKARMCEARASNEVSAGT